MTLTIRGILLALAMLAAPGIAVAQSKRTFVSGTGVDSGPCSISAPCRTFAYAVTQTAANGELVVKDGAGYGPVTITQSITIANDGVGTASIAVPNGGSGIQISAGSGSSVQLRGIEIDGNGVGEVGIFVTSSANIEIINCVVRHATQAGLQIDEYKPRIVIDNTRFEDNQGSGILTNAIGGLVAVARSSLSNNGAGIASANGGETMVVRDSVIANNMVGVAVSGGNVLLSHSMIVGNTQYGLSQNGGQLVTYGDNNINFNGTDVAGTVKKYTTE